MAMTLVLLFLFCVIVPCLEPKRLSTLLLSLMLEMVLLGVASVEGRLQSVFYADDFGEFSSSKHTSFLNFKSMAGKTSGTLSSFTLKVNVTSLSSYLRLLYEWYSQVATVNKARVTHTRLDMRIRSVFAFVWLL